MNVLGLWNILEPKQYCSLRKHVFVLSVPDTVEYWSYSNFKVLVYVVFWNLKVCSYHVLLSL